jgi:diguanylate cyclase (GGDEF)-like protein
MVRLTWKKSPNSVVLPFVGAIVFAIFFFGVSMWESSRTEARARSEVVRFASAFVTTYANHRSNDMPLPAAFRRLGLEAFVEKHEHEPGSEHAPLTVRVPGTPGLELAVQEPDARLALMISILAQNPTLPMIEEHRIENGRVVARSIFPSIARSETCVSCHNEVLKREAYKVGDVMGAFVVESDLTSAINKNLAYSGIAFFAGLMGCSLLARREHRRMRSVVELETQVQLERQKTASEAKAKFLLAHDSLTGLAKRAVFLDRLESELNSDGAQRLYIVLVDIDDFKAVNDTFGHDAGDALLVAVANRLDELAKSNGGSAARLGGDEFAVILHQTDVFPTENQLGKFVAEAMRAEVSHEGLSIRPSCSVGVTALPESLGTTVSALLKSADAALYAAKNAGKNQHQVFDEKIRQSMMRRSIIGSALPKAIEDGEIRVAFQPKVCLRNEMPTEFEALARWSLNGEDVAPDEFIKIAEDNGRVQDIDLAVLRQAAQFAVEAASEANVPIKISSNLSALGFRSDHIADRIEAILLETGLSPKLLTLEVTESVLIENATKVNEILGRLRQRGVKVALDDFGTGFASLRYLRQLLIDEIKIDRSFVVDVVEDCEKYFLFNKIVEMAIGLNKTIVVEGIENKAQADLIMKSGVKFGQGYYYSVPLGLKEAKAYCIEHMKKRKIA